MTKPVCRHWPDHVFDLLGTDRYQCTECGLVVNGEWFERLPSAHQHLKDTP